MKHIALIASALATFVLTPTAAFAHDKYRDGYCNDALAQIYADRRANGYYDNGQSVYSRGYNYSVRDYRDYRKDRDCDRDRDHRKGGFWLRFN